MPYDNDPPIKKQVYWGFGLIIVLFFFLGIISIFAINSLSSLTTTLYNHPLQVSNAALQASLGTAKMHRDMKDVVLADDSQSLEAAIDRVSQEEKTVLQYLNIVRRLILGPEGQALERKARTMFLEWRPIRQEVIQFVKIGERQKAAQITKGKGADHEFQLEQQMLSLTAYAHDKADGFIKQTMAVERRYTLLTDIALALGTILSCFIAFFTSRQILSSFASRKKAEEELHTQKRFLQEAIDAQHDTFFLFDPTTGKAIQWNTAFTAISGYSDEEIASMKAPENFYSKEDLEKATLYIEHLLNGGSGTVELDLITKDGKKVPTEYSASVIQDKEGNPQHVISIGRDVSDRKESADAAERQSQFLQTIIDSPPYPFYVVDVKDHSLIIANSSAASTDYWPGKTCYELTHHRDTPCDGIEHACPLLEVKRTNAPVALQHIHYNQEGEECIVEVNGYPICDDDGNVIHMIEYAKDITKKVEILNEKKELEARLRQTYKMEAVGTMAGGIAHDFNNILMAILGYTEMAKDDITDSHPAKHMLEEVVTAGNRAKELVHQILAFSRMSTPVEDHAPINLSPIVKEVLKFQRSVIPSTVEITSDIDENCGQIIGEPTQIHQVLVNLCTNASHAMEEKGGTLHASLSKTELSAGDLANEPQLHPGPYIRLAISDTGVGLTPELISRIFDPYFTTKDVGKGSGMGLAVVHGIVKKHNGFIKVESNPKQGSTFTVFLPRVEKTVKTEEEEKPEEAPKGSEKILFIDDEEMLAKLAQSILESLGYAVTVMTDSSKALALFQENPTAFDLVITDQTMPGIPGSELAKKLLKLRPDIPIILCTGYSSMIDEIKAQEIGIKEYTMKPVKRNEIAKLIRKVLDDGRPI